MFPSINEQLDLIKSGAIEIIPEEELIRKLEKSIKTNKQLIIKLGCDPSKPDLHIGHAVVLGKLRQFQDLGHKAILIIGDFTAMIGDPSGKNKTRPPLSLEETRRNGQTYLEQATRILKEENLEVRYNSEWLNQMNFNDVIALAAKYTVAQMLERDDFSKRYGSGLPISLHELLYPLAQAMDSVVINSDVELGGTDQKFNLLVGREIQKAYNKEPQCILTMPILEGTDGVEKMSKSLNNYIAITDPPGEMFGKTMSIPDDLIVRYFRYAARANDYEVLELEKGLKSGEIHPRNAKVQTAKRIIELYYSREEADKAEEEFQKIFVNKDIPTDINEKILTFSDPVQPIMDILVASELMPSKKEAKRKIEEGGVYIDGERVIDPFMKLDLSTRKLFKVGKKTFLYLKNNA